MIFSKALVIAAAIAASIFTGFVAYGLHALDVKLINARHAQALTEQKAALEAQCLADKQLTAEVSREYQSQVATLADQLDDLKRVRPSACIFPAPKPAAGRDAAAASRQPAQRNGVDTDTLYNFAAKAEQYRLRLLSCQRFIRDVWAARGQ